MELILKSERLVLRPMATCDLDLSIELCTSPDVMKYVGDVETEDQIIRKMPNYVKRCANGSIGVWCVADLLTNEKLGDAVLLPLPIDEDDTNWDLVSGDHLPEAEIEIGYMLKKSAWGKGYATEICRRMLKFGFEETPLPEIVAVTDPKNTASQNVLKKSGLREKGMRRAYAEQCTAFRMTRQQWQESSQEYSG